MGLTVFLPRVFLPLSPLFQRAHPGPRGSVPQSPPPLENVFLRCLPVDSFERFVLTPPPPRSCVFPPLHKLFQCWQVPPRPAPSPQDLLLFFKYEREFFSVRKNRQPTPLAFEPTWSNAFTCLPPSRESQIPARPCRPKPFSLSGWGAPLFSLIFSTLQKLTLPPSFRRLVVRGDLPFFLFFQPFSDGW